MNNRYDLPASRELKNLLGSLVHHHTPLTDDLPTFGGDWPEYTSEVWSWDKAYMIVGVCPSDLVLYPRPAGRDQIHELLESPDAELAADAAKALEDGPDGRAWERCEFAIAKVAAKEAGYEG